ncbi:hypothetical protein K491DRAFT_673770 [Lophiostoma macrostomum CBS 122681]|uniref:Uncharacterized protein n=1 Tax=Lophiostoma macrostomum CBS 122681 TaxID=1314788 RepID=A0A6A6TNR5_9PLEO|nr:hypothetical protein K491DRAFT_673770 [Lophiostoma macrostomum CBS 122681]
MPRAPYERLQNEWDPSYSVWSNSLDKTWKMLEPSIPEDADKKQKMLFDLKKEWQEYRVTFGNLRRKRGVHRRTYPRATQYISGVQFDKALQKNSTLATAVFERVDALKGPQEDSEKEDDYADLDASGEEEDFQDQEDEKLMKSLEGKKNYVG